MSGIPISLTICSWREFNVRLTEERFDVIVSFKDPTRSPNWGDVRTFQRHSWLLNHCDKVICLDFYDTTERRPNVRGPTASVIERLVRFFRTVKPGSKVIVHCMAGISRSTAAATILLREMGVEHELALSEVIRVRAIAKPNTLMLELYESVKDALTPTVLEMLVLPNADEDVDDKEKDPKIE